MNDCIQSKVLTSPDSGDRCAHSSVVKNHQMGVNPLSVNSGLPELDLKGKTISYFEFWPTWFFYIPVVVFWILLSIRYRSFGLPLLANPNIFMGGMVGESKADILNQAGELASDYILPFVVISKTQETSNEDVAALTERAILEASKHQLSFPLVAKPDLGCRGNGVRVVSSRAELYRYIEEFPSEREFLLQKLAPYQAEAGVFYERWPNSTKGCLTSITLKYTPSVTGDGVKTLEELILMDPRASKISHIYLTTNKDRLNWVPLSGEKVALIFTGSHSRGSIFRNGNSYITDKLTDKIDQIMCDFPQFHYGRLDIKFQDLDKLQNGEEFVIIEVNGTSSEATHIWDSRGKLLDVFRTLFRQYYTLFKMGDYLRSKGHRPPLARTMIKLWLRELKHGKTYPSAN